MEWPGPSSHLPVDERQRLLALLRGCELSLSLGRGGSDKPLMLLAADSAWLSGSITLGRKTRAFCTFIGPPILPSQPPVSSKPEPFHNMDCLTSPAQRESEQMHKEDTEALAPSDLSHVPR